MPEYDLELIEAKGDGWQLFETVQSNLAKLVYAWYYINDVRTRHEIYMQLHGIPDGAILFARGPITRFDRLLSARSTQPGRIIQLDSYQHRKAKRRLKWAVRFKRVRLTGSILSLGRT